MFGLSSDCVLQPLMDLADVTTRQQLPPVYELNGALYLATRSFLEREKCFRTDQTIGYVMPPAYSVDIDTPLDWRWAEFLMQYNQQSLKSME